MLSPDIKQKIIKKFRTHTKDTGSPEVQIAILTEEVNLLTEHLNQHPQDYSSRRGLLKKVHQRRALLRYLARENQGSYENLVKKLKLKEFKKLNQLTDDLFAEEELTDEQESDDTKENSDSNV